MWIFRSVSVLFAIFGIAVAAAAAWFIPWVFTLHLGVLVYFPYQPRSQERYMRVTGPWSGAYSRNWVDGKDIPKACKLALVAAEDTKFFIHHGIDLESLEKSYEYNQRKRKAKRGGSTITQQLVKNAFLSRERSYLRKAREIIGAILLDATAGKDMQLNWYFNIVEFGPNIYGIKDAAQFYFKKQASALSQRECASLVSILPSPNRWNKSLKSGSPSGFLSARIGTVMTRMKMIPTDESLTGRTGTLAAGLRKPKNATAAEGTSENLPLPQMPDEMTASEQLEKAELQAEQADQLDLPEEAEEFSAASGNGGSSPASPEASGAPNQTSENIEIIDP